MLKIDKQFRIYANGIAKEFYKNFNSFNLKNIGDKKILELKSIAPYLLNEEAITSNKFVNYIKSMKKLIKENKYKKYTDNEKYLLFMFSVDPTLEVLKIYGECDKVDQTKLKMGAFLGVYDSKLIKIEKEFIKKFLSKEELNKLNEEIEKRVFK
jgi:hypothetical protein